ncbi:hypothetical protein WR25_23044 [Diploscapter pachys]|uniref:Uncharacterized protein n=1 Tax=Diploscapter pachys TaxID=2018661 RepID=A0A2A2JCR8_9BILA|nr:hypothetical protein WR25_23044 [Diploscapter pachys]
MPRLGGQEVLAVHHQHHIHQHRSHSPSCRHLLSPSVSLPPNPIVYNDTSSNLSNNHYSSNNNNSKFSSASNVFSMAIDSKIEQAMDLVKTHLMFAVREEVEVLRGRIGELEKHINQLESENAILREHVPPHLLRQITPKSP